MATPACPSPGRLGVRRARDVSPATTAARRHRRSSSESSALAKENAQSPPPSSSSSTKTKKATTFSSCPNWHPLSTPATWSGTEDDALALAPGSAGFASLPPPWKFLLLSDGSVTRHLHILTGKPVAVDLLEMGRIDDGDDGTENADESFSTFSSSSEEEDDDSASSTSVAFGLPSGAELLRGPLVQRRVLLRADGGAGEALVYAASWWNERDAAAALDGKKRKKTKTKKESKNSLTSSPCPSLSPSSASPSPSRSQPIWTSLASSRTELFREIRTLYLGGCPALEAELGAARGQEMWGRHYLFWSDGRPLTVIYEVFSPRLERWLGSVGEGK